MEEFIELDDTDFKQRIEETKGGIVLFYKRHCPHCKNMEKVLMKFSAKVPAVSLMVIDSEACCNAMQTLDVERVPTLVIVKDGKVATTRAGLMNPKELRSFYESV